jgi:integrase
MLATVRLATTKTVRQLFTDYVADFWTADSPYCREAAVVNQRPLSAAYIDLNHKDVKRHLETYPPFARLALKNVTSGHIRDWRIWAAEKGLSGSRINTIMKAMRVAVRYAVDRGDLPADPFLKIGKAPEKSKEKGVLTQKEAVLLMTKGNVDPRDRAAILLGALCGLRRGEVRGLQWGDIDIENAVINVVHNWQDMEGVKAPKSGSTGTVPMSEAVVNALEAVRQYHRNPTSDAFVFERVNDSTLPMSGKWLEYALGRCLGAIGIDEIEQRERNITLHSLRHTFVTLGRLAGLNDFEIATLARHHGTGNAMTERYSHGGQAIDMEKARAKKEAAAV